MIVRGQGMGQLRSVVDVAFSDVQTLTVDQPWRINPDSSSEIVLMNSAYQWTIRDSIFQGDERVVYAEEDDIGGNATANCGISSYGGVTEMTVDNCLFNQVETGVAFWNYTDGSADYDGEKHVQLSAWNLVHNNSFTNNARAVQLFGNGSMPTRANYKAIFASSIRDNTMELSLYAPFRELGQNPDKRNEMMIFEGNTNLTSEGWFEEDNPPGYNTYTNRNVVQ
jgi:hypothetical protein